MELFDLPNSTKVNRVIPKNAFDIYTNSKQKKQFADYIGRITWLNKLSPDTINLEAKEIKEIQIFYVELKMKEDVRLLLEVIDKSIPYNIVFIVEYDDSIYLSTSIKHSHVLNENNTVIDWTIQTTWFIPSENKYNFKLKKSIDSIYHDFCIQLSGKIEMASKPLADLIQYEQQIQSLNREIASLKSKIVACKQFNKKVELNLKLKSSEKLLAKLQE